MPTLLQPVTSPRAPLQVLVTRPQPQADRWVADLMADGLAAHALPLIAISGPEDPRPVQALWHDMSACRLLMFVSPAAVEWFFRLRPAGATWPPGTLAAAPGPGTARALLAEGEAAGLTPAQVLSPDTQSEQFDSEHLWPLLAPLDWADQAVRIISGGDENEAKGRTWLTEQWRARGARVAAVLSYQRGPGHWPAAQQQLAREAFASPARFIWLVSSSQALDHLLAVHLPALHLPAPPDWSAVRVLVTHPRIAEHAQQIGVHHILQTRPTLAAVVQALRTAT
ncbi:MAG: uroporphyrinogen-III synthase [Aquabacterium sp.]